MDAETIVMESGVVLPKLANPTGDLGHGFQTGNLLFISYKGPHSTTGKVGQNISVEDAYEYSREIGLYLLSAIQHDLGSLNNVARVVKVIGLVNSDPSFIHHPKVIEGCSDLFDEIFGETEKDSRIAVGVSSLPDNMPVEIEAVVEVRTPCKIAS
ncbi:RidA family protein [Enterovibrio baiacu]|uniref:RidA family protein n=1 Tax=Enterovibrio baiacu TaxID=2491023 RepID=UPI003D0B9876